jgi:hypothetical protein
LIPPIGDPLFCAATEAYPSIDIATECADINLQRSSLTRCIGARADINNWAALEFDDIADGTPSV